MFGLKLKKENKALRKWIDEHTTSNNPTITLKDNNFPKAVLANLVATHGVDSNDCKNHQRDRDNAMSGILNAISCGSKEFLFLGKLNEYVIAELQEVGYDIRFEWKDGDEYTIIRWNNAYLTS